MHGIIQRTNSQKATQSFEPESRFSKPNQMITSLKDIHYAESQFYKPHSREKKKKTNPRFKSN